MSRAARLHGIHRAPLLFVRARAPVALLVSVALLVCCALCDADCCNVCHISPYAVTEGILAGASRLLAPDGVLCVYGPFMVDGAHTAESNAAFDERLRSQDALWGVRCSTAIAQEADAIGLELVASEPMPANNFVLVFRRKGGPAAA